MIEVICCVGLEGSGTQMMTWTLLEHPDVGQTLHQSYPTQWKGSPYKRLGEYGRWNGCKSMEDKTAPIVVMFRDRTCAAKSNERRGFFHVDEVRRNRVAAAAEMWNDLATWCGPALFVSYEGLAEHGATYFALILMQLGLDPARFPWNKFKIFDANRKYTQ